MIISLLLSATSALSEVLLEASMNDVLLWDSTIDEFFNLLKLTLLDFPVLHLVSAL